jgi:aryl-alcohol dehydrogenase-like predicted oxidoreductase
MTDRSKAGTFKLGERTVKRMGYGAMQLAGPGVFGAPKDRYTAIAVLREAVASGVNHIDTSDFYGPHVTNQIIVHGPAEGPIEAPLTVLADLQRQGLVRHIGLSNVTANQIEEGRRICGIVCVQNNYNIAHRDDDAMIDEPAAAGIAYVPFFPLGGFTPLQSTALSDVAKRLDATPMQIALAWLLKRAPNILLIPGTSSLGHLRENLAASELELPADAMARLDAIGKNNAPMIRDALVPKASANHA